MRTPARAANRVLLATEKGGGSPLIVYRNVAISGDTGKSGVIAQKAAAFRSPPLLACLPNRTFHEVIVTRARIMHASDQLPKHYQARSTPAPTPARRNAAAVQPRRNL
jgi:hypothetical protein